MSLERLLVSLERLLVSLERLLVSLAHLLVSLTQILVSLAQILVNWCSNTSWLILHKILKRIARDLSCYSRVWSVYS
ncbi:hypothetical protein ABE132_09310 [Peribacillus simplex]|uniref:hypothetical protein n=1 Tax=Peribacillus simplex TaxID=1478 RepID=UPI003D2D8F52